MSEPSVIYPLRDIVLFPGQRETLRDMRELGANAVAAASESGAPLLCVTQTDPRADEPANSELFEYGTVARIVDGTVGGMGYHVVTLEGVARGRVRSVRREGGCLRAEWERFESRGPEPDRELMDELLALARKARERLPRAFPQDWLVPAEYDDAEAVIDTIAAQLGDEYARPPRKMQILDKQDPSDRARVLKFLFIELLKPRPMGL